MTTVQIIMRNKLRNSLFMALVVCSFHAKCQTDQLILQTNQARFAAMISADTAQLSIMLHPDLMYIHSNGLIETKLQHLDNIKSGKLIYKTITSSNEKVRKKGKVVLLNGQLNAAGTLNEKDFEVRLLYTAVYLRTKRKWTLWSWQSTGLK